MAMIFDRPAFGSGLMVLEYNDTNGDPIRMVLKPTDRGKSIDFPSEAQANQKYGNGKWLLTPAEQNSRRNKNKADKDNNDPRKF